MVQTVLIQVLIPSLSLQEDLNGHEEESQETRIEMWVLAWPTCGGIKCPETEMAILSARRAVVLQNGQAALASELHRCEPRSQFGPYQMGDLLCVGVSCLLFLSLCLSICKMGMGHPAIRPV